MQSTRVPALGLALLALVTFGWGFAWPVIKVVLAEVPPLTFRSLCIVIGGAGVLALARLTGQTLAVPVRYWGQLAAISACNIVAWNVFVIYGVSRLPSGRAALLGYTMPLWSTLLSVWLLNEPLTARRILSLLLGMAGILVLLGADLAGFGNAVFGVALMLAAAISWGLGVVLLKRFAVPIPTGSLTGWTMFGGGIPVAVAAVALEHQRWHAVSTAAGLGLAYSIVVVFMFCYWAWNRVVLMLPVPVSSVSSLATPIIGVLSSMWLLAEPLTWHEVVACAFIIGALLLARPPPAANRASLVPSRSSLRRE